MGKISYSLYLVHGVPGFVMMYWLIDLGLQVSISIIVTSFCLLFGASMFYRLVEKDAQKSKFGKIL